MKFVYYVMMKIFVVGDTNTLLNVILIRSQRGIIVISENENFGLDKDCNNARHEDSQYTIVERYDRKIPDLSVSQLQLQINSLYFGKLLKELSNSAFYRNCFIKNYKNVSKLKDVKEINLLVKLECTDMQIGYSWEYRCNYLLQEKEHLNSAMSWLSTLGGAFSALGDFDPGFAERAGATSYKQMLIACRLGDLNLLSRCWLYCSVALIQKRKFKKAAAIIKHVFDWAKQQPEGKADHRVVNMCHGIWTKLKYERNLFASNSGQTNSTSRRL